MADITSRPFGITAAGEAVTLYTMKNSKGMSVGVLDYGCTVQSILVKSSGGEALDVVLGYDDAAGYENGSSFFGTFVGRYANRIKGSAFDLGGKHYEIPANEGKNHLHGVLTKTVFEASEDNGSLVLKYLSPDREEGFPGNLDITVKYSLTEENELVMEYTAVTDADTVVNFTNHSYFNLNGCNGGDILGHTLTLEADQFTEGGPETIPTGRILPVRGTPMDFTAGKTVGQDIRADFEQLRLCRGYDHNFILRGEDGKMKCCAVLKGEKSGITMECSTTQPAVQLYTGNFVDDTGKGGVKYGQYSALCLETQHYPCSPNFLEFPSTVLRPGEVYHQTTVYKFMN